MKAVLRTFLCLVWIASVYGYTRNDCICGIANKDPSPKLPKYAWMAVLLTRDEEAFCSGALVSDRNIITAGSCVSFEYVCTISFIFSLNNFSF